MTQAEVEQYIAQLPDVQREEAQGYVLYFIGDDHLVPFVSLATRDQEADNVSHLSRPGVFRINIGVGKQAYAELVGHVDAAMADYTQLNVFLPHPHYAAYYFVCILNPAGAHVARTQQLIAEAHAQASDRAERQRRATRGRTL